MAMPPDLKIAYETFTLLCLRHDYRYAALMISSSPVQAFVIGDITERGHALASLLRKHADYIDQCEDEGRVAENQPPTNTN